MKPPSTLHRYVLALTITGCALLPTGSGCGATAGSCVACNGNYGSGASFACGVGAQKCRTDGYCGVAVATGAACSLDGD